MTPGDVAERRFMARARAAAEREGQRIAALPPGERAAAVRAFFCDMKRLRDQVEAEIRAELARGTAGSA